MTYALTPYNDEPAATAQSAVATTAITTLANQIRSDLVTLNAIKGSI